MGNVKKELFSYLSILSLKGASTRGTMVWSLAPALSEPPPCALSLSALDHYLPAGMASIHILHHHFQADVAHSLPAPSCSPAYLPFWSENFSELWAAINASRWGWALYATLEVRVMSPKHSRSPGRIQSRGWQYQALVFHHSGSVVGEDSARERGEAVRSSRSRIRFGSVGTQSHPFSVFLSLLPCFRGKWNIMFLSSFPSSFSIPSLPVPLSLFYIHLPWTPVGSPHPVAPETEARPQLLAAMNLCLFGLSALPILV